MDEGDWKVLLDRVKQGQCTPFLGAGVNYGILPLGGEIAHDWAAEHGFPLRSSDDLSSVAQFVAVKYDAMYPKDRILDRLRAAKRPDFKKPDERLECLGALAELPLPVYLTTNYDDLMVQALRHTNPPKNPRREICRWHRDLRKGAPRGAELYNPDYANPVVFHLHGSDEYRNSLVLTEDDYLDFLVNISRNQKLLPPRIQQALTQASLLFIGYRLRDINFRVIYRGLVQSMDGSQRSLGVTVQVKPPDDHVGDPADAEKFLTDYFDEMKVRVYWGTATEFAKELRDRWRNYRESNP
jgi:hypothetical protein